MYCRYGDVFWLEFSAIPKSCLISKYVFMMGLRCWYGLRLVLWSLKLHIRKQEFISVWFILNLTLYSEEARPSVALNLNVTRVERTQ